ncbi:regulator of G-protein signaling 13-like [Athene noctua]|uniref:regulator of G-protein signaling 13-like n=1 Tax=Athene noctua TaxID=126797 RepID=UPI003EC135E5
MSPNTFWLCKIFRAEENGISFKWHHLLVLNSFKCLMTLENAKVYSQENPETLKPMDLQLFMKDGSMIYKTYLKIEHSDENIEFWLACEVYKKITSQRKRISVARKLFTSYIQPQAPNEVNIDSPVRKAIIRNIQEPTQSCFNEAQRIIYMHMERDSYPRFLQSKFSQKLKHNLQTNGNNSRESQVFLREAHNSPSCHSLNHGPLSSGIIVVHNRRYVWEEGQ